jgi:hypothetical protein
MTMLPGTAMAAPQHDELAMIVAAARRRAARGDIVIAFANTHYVDVLMNWLVALAANGIDNYLVIALDEALYRFLDERGVPVALSTLGGELRELWVRRIQVFAALCIAGIDFVHSDVDAVWMRDPRTAHLSDLHAELTISQGTIWPPEVHQRFGFVLCCGLFRLRSGPRTRQLLGELEAHVLQTGDDQVSLNRLIAARAPTWQIARKDAYYIQGGGQRFLCSRSLIRGVANDGLRVALLPHHLFQRVAVPSTDLPYVLHRLTPKQPAAKLQEFARHGCLWLRPDWRDIEFDRVSIVRLRLTGRDTG